jgi:hypothetical protein
VIPSLWHRDFRWHWNGVTVRQTGAFVPYGEIISVLKWMRVYGALLPLRLNPFRKTEFTLAGVPDAPRPWYLLWPVVILAGGRWVGDARRADWRIRFEDTTRREMWEAESGPMLNERCNDVSKSHVAQVFEDCFGYALAVNPAQHQGPMVEKGELNGAHDGQVIEGPVPTQPGRVYQRLIDNSMANGLVEDLRCPTVFGQIAVVFCKRRPVMSRFDNFNTEVLMATPEALFNDDERQKIAAFCAGMGLDWGGLDILRDAGDGRLYIVDVNNTDMGPPIAMAFRDQLIALRKLADLLRRHLAVAGADDDKLNAIVVRDAPLSMTGEH